MSDLERYLAQAAEVGRPTSSGKFTLDYQAALAKLRRYQLRSPSDFLVRLVTGAIGLGAPRVDVEVGRAAFAVRFPGQLTGEQLAGLFSHALTGCEDGWDDLAVGVNGALATGVDRVVVRSGGVVAEYSPEYQSILSGEARDEVVVEAEVEVVEGASRLKSECRLVPVPLTCNGLEVNQPDTSLDTLFGREVAVCLVVPDPDPGSDSLMAASEKWPGTVLDSAPARHCTAVLGVPEDEAAGELLFVHRGVELARLPHELSPASAVGVVSAAGLQRDLSGLALVQDAAFARRLTWLQSQLDHLQRRLRERYPGLPLEELLKAARYRY